MFNKKILSLAVVASFGGLMASQANAALSTNGSELPATNVLTPTTTTWTRTLTTFAPTNANPLYITYSLSGGANYSASPTLACSGTGDASVYPTAAVLAAGGAGNSVATFTVTGLVTAGVSITSCTITNGAISAVNWPTGITESYSATYGNNLAPATVGSTALFAASSIFTNVMTATTNLSPVASGFISFTGGVTTAQIGSINILINANVADGGNAANTTGLSNYVTGVTFSLAGTPLAFSPRVYVTQTAATGPATCASPVTVSAVGASTITFSGFVPSTSANVYYAVCMAVTGQVIPTGTITFGMATPGAADGAATPATGTFQITSLYATGTTLGTITHNGASTEVLNLPPSTNADAGFLRIYNNSTLSGAVTATVYNEAGTALATNCALGTLAAQNTLSMAASTLESTCSITPPATGRYRIVVNGAFSSMRAQSLARTGGVLVNMSPDTSNGSNN